MTLAITEDHRLLAETARSLLERQGGTAGAREAAEGGGDKLPSGWDELVGVGWLGLHVGEDVGGQGYGLPELAVVLSELGRVVGPGAFLPSVWAAAVIEQDGSEEQRRVHLPDLVTGRRIGAVGLGGRIAREGSSLTGEGLGLGGLWADLLVLGVGADIALVDRHADGVSVTVGDGLDRSQPLARVDLDRVPLDDAALLPGAASPALDLGRVLAAAEAAGGAEACTDLATAYAKERRQFGRVIGSFQAVKHHLADMLVDSELAAAAAWDAARSGAADRQQELCATYAALQSLPAYVRNAKTSIQVHGGIGFTWEHDAHLYLRRATALAALFTSAPDPADQAVALARAGVRRSSDVELPGEAEEYRREVRAFRHGVVGLDPGEQRRKLVESGYLVPHWPRPWGRDAGPVEQLVIDEELEGSVARPALGISGWVTLTIAQHGTPDQLERWVGPSLAGELAFCQLFSEPEAGSDAAAVKTSGTRVDGGWLVNGQKVWT
ncbi:MAG: acyl-CoA dehydrogenase, partial [Acidimicrobiales bacterium]